MKGNTGFVHISNSLLIYLNNGLQPPSKLVNYGDTEQLSNKIGILIEQPDKCVEFGKEGRKIL